MVLGSAKFYSSVFSLVSLVSFSLGSRASLHPTSYFLCSEPNAIYSCCSMLSTSNT